MIRYLTLGLIACFLAACNGAIGGVATDGELPNSSRSGFPSDAPGSVAGLPPGGALPPESIDGPPDAVVNVPPEELLDIPPEDLANVPPAALIKASRSGCTSPCPVFFDAISDHSWEDIETSTFTWAFSDGATSDGYMAAHVFELPEGSGEETFEVILVVKRQGVAVAQDTHTITVQPSLGRSVCVAESDFSSCPSNDDADHFTSVSAAWNAIQTNGRILFRRGDSFSDGFQFSSTVPGPVQVGAFGDPGAARPTIAQVGGSWRLESQWSVTDLDISAAAIDEPLIRVAGDHTLVMRSHIRDATSAIQSDGEGYDFSTHKFIINNVVTGFTQTHYLAGDYIAIMGNYMERSTPDQHTIRIGGGKHVLVAGNELIADVGHSSLTVRGAGTRRLGSDYVLVQDNLLMQWASVHPQDTQTNERLQHVIWERNVHVPHDSQTSFQDGLSINGHDMVIRNNVFHQIRRAINIENHPLAGPSRNIHVYHNTHFLDRDTGRTSWLFMANNAGTGLVVRNNLGEHYSTSADSRFISVDAADAVIENNYGYTPSRTSYCETPGGGSTCVDPRLENTADRGSASFMRPGADSLAVNAAVDVPVSNDIRGTFRPQGGAPDVGAVERPQ